VTSDGIQLIALSFAGRT